MSPYRGIPSRRGTSGDGDTTISLLLFEDNPGDVRLIREMVLTVTNQNVELVHVDTLKGGLQRLQEDTFDAILLDLSLPDSHGIDTLLKVSVAAPDIAIVVLTGNEDQDLGLRAVQMGAQDYLPKVDVNSKVLIRALRYAIERYRIEVMIRKSEQEYRSLIDDVFDTSMVAVMILNRDYMIVWCNEATEIYFGIPKDGLIGRDSQILIDEELKCVFADPDDYAAQMLSAYQDGGFTQRFECRVIPEDKRQARWLEHWSQPIRDGMYVGGRIEQYMDITERKKLEISLEEQRKFAEALRDISTLLTSTLDLKEVLGRILNSLGRILPHDLASIRMLGENRSLVADNPPTPSQAPVWEEDEGLSYQSHLDEMLETGKPVIVPDLQMTQSDGSTERGDVHSYVGAPIRLQNEVIGFMYVFSKRPDFFKDVHAERLMVFAELAAIAIQNAQLFEQSQGLAAVEERQRLARELHDSVSQTLFTSRNMAESALRRWDKDPVRARQLTEEVHQLTITALAEMRILLLELRPASLTHVTLKQLFEQYLQPIQKRRQFNLRLNIADIPPLPPDVQIALYRIVQEALNNIDKHARAREVIVHVENYDDHIALEISDDGEGFDSDATHGTSLGLGIMRERADTIKAALQIESKIGEGTRITVTWYKNTP